MFRRRRDRDDESQDAPETGSEADAGALDDATDADDDEARKPERPEGPWDADEVDLADEEFRRGRLDLGALVIKGRPAMQLRIDVDPQSRRVRSVTFLAEGSGLQVQAFAAPRSAPIWPDVRAEIAADCARRGGVSTEIDGPYGTELQITLPVTTSDGRPGKQISRIVGVDGPRWLLRASFLGAATDPDLAGDLSGVLRDIVVVRGSDPMAPRDMLPLRVPAGPGVGVAGAADPAAGPAPAREPLAPFRRGPEITEVN